MLDITHYHSLDELLENGPSLDHLCSQCRRSNLAQLFSGPRYEDFQISYEGDRKLDVLFGKVSEIRSRTANCRMCHIVIAFHDAVHTGLEQSSGQEGCDEALESAILKPYRTDVILHTPDLSNKSDKGSIATSLALVFTKDSKQTGHSVARVTTMRPKKVVLGQGIADSPQQKEHHDKPESPSSANGVFEESFPVAEMPRRPYSLFNCLFSLTEDSFVARRRVLSYSDSTRGSRIDWSSLKAWMTACEDDHPMCRPKFRLFAGDGNRCIRCIDLESSTIVSIGPETRYVALSYVWGTARDQIVEHIDHCVLGVNSTIITESLPQTIRDALRVTAGLGERYLWVDCLCIKQSDPSDLVEQIGLMDRIYENAVVTIVTSTTTNIHSQIPGLRSYSRVKSTSEVKIDGRVVKAVCAASVVGEFHGPWSSRAWTYQEWLLSPRCLFFSKNQILFRCQLLSGLESFLPPRADHFPSIGAMPRFWAERLCDEIALPRLPLDMTSWNFGTYAELVRDYTNRILSRDTDIISAFAGLMSKLEYCTEMTFVEGLPQKDLLNALTWTTVYSSRFSEAPCVRRQHRPSWAWDGWISTIRYPCWQILESPDLALEFSRCYEEVRGKKPPRSRRAKKWASRTSQIATSVIISMLTSYTVDAQQVPHRAYQMRRATLSLSSATDAARMKELLIRSETRSVLIKLNPTPAEQNRLKRDDVLNPGSNKIISGHHFPQSMIDLGRGQGSLSLFSISISDCPEASSCSTLLHRDAILLYEWKIEASDGKWYDRVLAMIINRLEDGVAERLAVTAFRSDDWYSLPSVKQVEDLALV